jgi:RNA polymerase sigma factor (sigma-70 family)
VPGISEFELERLYRDQYAAFVRVATAVLHDEDRAVDVVQDAFAAALRNRRSFRGDGPLEGWVWRIVINQAKKARRRSNAPAMQDAENGERELDPSPVREAIARLPERQRLVLFLRYYADLDYRQIGATLEIASGTVGATLRAAHRSLRNALKEAI